MKVVAESLLNIVPYFLLGVPGSSQEDCSGSCLLPDLWLPHEAVEVPQSAALCP